MTTGSLVVYFGAIQTVCSGSLHCIVTDFSCYCKEIIVCVCVCLYMCVHVRACVCVCVSLCVCLTVTQCQGQRDVCWIAETLFPEISR